MIINYQRLKVMVLCWSWVTLPVIYVPDSSTALCQLSWMSNIKRDPQPGTVWMADPLFCVILVANNS